MITEIFSNSQHTNTSAGIGEVHRPDHCSVADVGDVGDHDGKEGSLQYTCLKLHGDDDHLGDGHSWVLQVSGHVGSRSYPGHRREEDREDCPECLVLVVRPDVLTECVVTPSSEALGLLLNTPGQE